ncbi:diguanylate cyclase domain-containing protein [Rhodococcus sp. 077-4]|uniref:diguanylate cyclase domain-containing protein n=1 Tax=Rhodococcus sp. 077-4 TaxID=2789271 RepID=UPI0039F4D37F
MRGTRRRTALLVDMTRSARALDEHLRAALHNARNSRARAALPLIDLDDSEGVDDRFGCGGGDERLVELAHRCRRGRADAACRSRDVPSRAGRARPESTPTAPQARPVLCSAVPSGSDQESLGTNPKMVAGEPDPARLIGPPTRT